MYGWVGLALALISRPVPQSNGDSAIHNIGIQIQNCAAGDVAHIYVISFVSWRLMESDDLTHWRETAVHILLSGEYDIYDLVQLGLVKARFWRVEELPRLNRVLPPQLE